MQVTHSPQYNSFLSFWFETSVDSVHVFDTVIDYHAREWFTLPAGLWKDSYHARDILVEGKYSDGDHENDDSIFEAVKNKVQAFAIEKNLSKADLR